MLTHRYIAVALIAFSRQKTSIDFDPRVKNFLTHIRFCSSENFRNATTTYALLALNIYKYLNPTRHLSWHIGSLFSSSYFIGSWPPCLVGGGWSGSGHEVSCWEEWGVFIYGCGLGTEVTMEAVLFLSDVFFLFQLIFKKVRPEQVINQDAHRHHPKMLFYSKIQ